MTAWIAELYNRLILERPKSVIAALLCVFVFFAWSAQDFKLDASADALLLEDDEDLRIFREMNERYESLEFLFVTFTPHQDLFADESLQQISSLRDELAQLPGVDSVLSLVDVPLLKIIGGKLSEVVKNYRTLQAADVDREQAREELLESPVFKELIISLDGKTTALLVNLKPEPEFNRLLKERNRLLAMRQTSGLSIEEELELAATVQEYDFIKTVIAEKNHANIMQIRALMEKYRAFGSLHLGGVPMISDDMISFIKNDLLIFGLGIFAFLLIMLSLIFRSPRWVLLPLLSCAFAGSLMIGLLGLSGWRVTVISSNFISLMLIITMSMNIHLIVRYRQLRQDRPQLAQRQLVFETCRLMVWPCLYTALTTMIGFASLVVSGIKPVMDFGWMMTMGLGLTFLTSFLLFPALLVLLDKSAAAAAGSRQEVPLTAALAACADKHGNKVLLIAALLGLVSLFGMTRLKVENSFVNYFSDSTEIHQGLKLIDEKLGGTTTLDILLHFDPAKEYGPDYADGELAEKDEFDALFGEIESDPAEAWFTSYKIDRIKAVHDYLQGIPAVGKVLSLAAVLDIAEELNEGVAFDAFELAIINKRMPEGLRQSMIDPYISIEDNEARITVRVMDSLKDLRRKELIEQIDAGLQQELGLEQDEYRMTGLLILYNNMLQSLFQSQIMTLGVVMAGIALMLFALFRSFKLALIGIIPNILAAGVILGLMGLLNIPLDMMTITIAAITIGIAVDNSIHYIYRYRQEFAKSKDYRATLYYCHANIGRAVFYTAITIIVGFSILVLSNFIPTIYFGLLTALAMFIALLAALTLLPRLILLWRPF